MIIIHGLNDIQLSHAWQDFFQKTLKKEIRGSKHYLILGIDVAKNKHHAFLGTTNGKTILRRLLVEDTASGFEYLLDMVQLYRTNKPRQKVKP